MIKLLENTDFLSGYTLPDDAFAAKITALLSAYGTESDFALFWYQIIGSDITALISRVDGNLTVSITDMCNKEEIAEFVSFIGYSSLQCDSEFSEGEGSYILEFVPSSFSPVEYDNPEYRDIYSLLRQCGFELGDYKSFLSDYALRISRSCAAVKTKYVDGVLASCASALFIGKSSVLLGAVATNISFRGNGYASDLVSALASSFEGKRVFLLTRNDGLLKFYEGIGFRAVGRYTEIKK